MRQTSFERWLCGVILACGAVLVLGIPAQAGGPKGTIDFEGLDAGYQVDQLSKGSGISGSFNGTVGVVTVGGEDQAIIFDSANPTGEDPDLGTPNEHFGGPGIGTGGGPGPTVNNKALGKVLIIAEDLVDVSPPDGLVDDPDDADEENSYVEFSFSKPVTVNSMTVLDVEAEEFVDDSIELSGPSLPVNFIAINPTGDNGVRTINGIGLSGVDTIRVNLDGSGAIAEIVLNEKVVRPCWITFGGFHNDGTAASSKDFTFGGNVGPPASGAIEVINHTTGDNFHSNDVQITVCDTIEATGPGQPGGKKGFDINRAFFEGTGRLNGSGSYPFTGFVIDAGEPGGKKGNDMDVFEIVVDVNSGLTFGGELDGGNVQIHPPVGQP